MMRNNVKPKMQRAILRPPGQFEVTPRFKVADALAELFALLIKRPGSIAQIEYLLHEHLNVDLNFPCRWASAYRGVP
jgi:hypothetical protein